eukprot:scaffold30696_cov29-Phaeocystis_antarctica.AAC.1
MRLPKQPGPGSDCSLRCSASGDSSQHWLLNRWGPATPCQHTSCRRSRMSREAASSGADA